jgi:glycosyltransferase involved in cell wall biosynthesis
LSSRNLISVVIPALNEEEGIARTINEIPKAELATMGYNCETVVVDGGSKDCTREIARKCGAEVIIEPRRGYGIAYKTGFANTHGEILVALDADFSYPAFLIPKLVKLLEEQGLDFVSTNRLNVFSQNSFHKSHIIGNKILTYFTRVLFRINISDSQSGMWVFRKKILETTDFSSNGMPFSEEIKIFAFKFFKSAEIAIPYRKRMGKQKLRTLLDGVKNLSYLFFLSVSFSNLARLSNSTKVINLKVVDYEVASSHGGVLTPLWTPKNWAM